MANVVQTDFAWPDDSIERAVIEAAGHQLITGPSAPASAALIEELVAAHDPVAIMACWAPVSAKAVQSPSDLKVVQRIGVGLDNIDVEAATARGAWVANVPDYCVSEVSDHAIAMLLAWARGIVTFDRAVKLGRWNPADARLRRVSDLVIGIVGYGPIAQSTAAKLASFACEVLVYRPSAKPVKHGRLVDFDTLLATSDVVILHAPYTPTTHHLIDDASFGRMKRGAFVINASRGALVDSEALISALESGQISGAGLDVVEGEPAPPSELVGRTDVIVTPHIAFSSEASLVELRRRAAEEVVRVLAGEMPHNPCNKPR